MRVHLVYGLSILQFVLGASLFHLDMCMCLARGRVGGVGGEWVRRLGLGFTNPGETGGKWDMCVCFGCGVGGVGGRVLVGGSGGCWWAA